MVSKSDQRMSDVALNLSRVIAREETQTRSRMLAYASVGRKIGRSASWVRRLIGQGIGRIDHEIACRLDALLIHGLENDIARLRAELDLARQRGDHPGSAHFSQVETLLARATSLMEAPPLAEDGEQGE